jgi:tRNA(Arg) A34 adenosine deaminase TadA
MVKAMNDQDYMKLALAQAEDAAQKGEVPIGAVLVDPANGDIVAKGHNLTITNHDPTAHAEIVAIRAACESLNSQRLIGLDLFVTLEPCTMCAAAISFSRLRRVVFGAMDEKGGGILHGAKFYNQKTCHHRPEIISGVMAEPCGKILKEFFQARRKNKQN